MLSLETTIFGGLQMRKFKLAEFQYYLSDESFWRVVCYLAANECTKLVGMSNARKEFMLSIDHQDQAPIKWQSPLETKQSDGIPKIVFQTWKSRVELPDNYRYWRNTFVKNNPDFQCLLWDDADNRAFIKDQFPWFLSVYEGFPAEIFRADAVRPFFLLRYGGLYADMDTECLKPIAKMKKSGDVVLGQMGPHLAFEHSIPNAMMASKPSQLFWALYIAMMIAKADELGSPEAMRQRGPEVCTGPILLREAFEFYRSEPEIRVRERAQPVIRQLSEALRTRLHGGKIELLAPTWWYPMDWNNRFHQRLRNELIRQHIILDPAEASALFPNAILVTYWTQSWVSRSKRPRVSK
jgi:inositol phosphorylceramide mannosyltransferase catalytic subunit